MTDLHTIVLPIFIQISLVLVSIFICLKHPVISVSILCFVPYLTKVTIGSYTLFHILWIGVLLSIIINLFQKKIKISKNITNVLFPLFLFSIWVFLNIYFPNDPDIDLGLFRYNLFLLRGLIPAIYLLFLIRDITDIETFLKAGLFCAVFSGLLSIFVYAQGLTTFSGEIQRLDLYNSNPLDIAVSVGIAASIAIGLFCVKGYIKTYWFLIITAISIVTILLAQARQAIVGLIFVIFFALFRNKNKLRVIIIGFFVFMLTGYLLLVLWKGTNLSDKFLNFFSDPSGAGENRYGYYIQALNDFFNHPIFGIGTAKFGNYVNIIINTKNKLIMDRDHAHNFFLELLSEQGLIGFILFCNFLFTSIFHFLKSRKDKGNDPIFYALTCSMIFIIIRSLFTGGFFTSYEMFWLPVIGYVYYSNTISKKKPQPDSVIHTTARNELRNDKINL